MDSSRAQCNKNLPLKVFNDNSDNLNGNSDTEGESAQAIFNFHIPDSRVFSE